MSFGVREGTAEAAIENADENKARLQDNCMGKAAPQFKIVNGLTQFLEPTSRSGSSFSEGRSLSEFFGMRYAHGPLIATFCKGLDALNRPARILVFQWHFRSKIPVAGGVLRSDLWRIEEGFRIPLPETRRGVNLRWEFGINRGRVILKQANSSSPPGLPRWFTGLCTTHLSILKLDRSSAEAFPHRGKPGGVSCLRSNVASPPLLRAFSSNELFDS